jgi:hypothetical protein
MKYLKKYEKYNNIYNNVALYLETIAPIKEYFLECIYDDVNLINKSVVFTYEYYDFPQEYFDDILDYIDDNFNFVNNNECDNCFSFTLTEEQIQEFNEKYLMYKDSEKYNL